MKIYHGSSVSWNRHTILHAVISWEASIEKATNEKKQETNINENQQSETTDSGGNAAADSR